MIILPSPTPDWEEKLWLCEQADNRIETTSYAQVRTKKGLVKRYGLHKNWFSRVNWSIYIDPKRTFHANSGRPDDIDDNSLLDIGRSMLAKQIVFNNIPKSQLRKLLKDEIDQSRIRRGLEPTDAKLCSEKVFQRFKTKHGIAVKSSDLNTAARLIACFCPRLSFAWFLVLYLISGLSPPMYKWNSDCSTYVF